MAGSWKHLLRNDGTFRGIELLDNLGDAYEALEECYGMILWLAGGDWSVIADAEQHYRDALMLLQPTRDVTLDDVEDE